MKRIISILIIGIVFLNFLYAQQRSSNSKGDTIVYITKSGKKYHSANCKYLKGIGIPKKLSEVKNKYSPCAKCNPINSQIKTNVLKIENSKNKQSTTSKETSTENNAKGEKVYTGSHGGKYHYSKNGKKVYEHKKK